MVPITVALNLKFAEDRSPYLSLDRRAAGRFPIQLDAKCKVLSKRHSQELIVKTIDVSSSGILFTTDQPLFPGKLVELSISWPAMLNARCRLKLVAQGRIVRVEPGRAAMEIGRYEFRTTTAHSLS